MRGLTRRLDPSRGRRGEISRTGACVDEADGDEEGGLMGPVAMVADWTRDT